MTSAHLADPSIVPTGSAKAITLALSLAQAEKAIHDFTAGQVDAIVDADGRAHLLQPAQEHLRQSERRLQAIIDGAADLIAVVNRGGTILSQNRAAYRLLGYSAKELVGCDFFTLIHEEDLPRAYSAFSNVIEGLQENAVAHFRLRAHDGSWRMIEATAGLMPDASPASIVLTMRLSVRPIIPPAEPTLRAAVAVPVERAKNRFLAMIAHELRTPLTPVLLGVAELEEEEQFAEARPILAMMRRNLEVQTRLIEELTDFALVGEHKVRLRLETIDLHETLRFVLEICRSEIADAKIEMRLDLGAAENVVVADSARLQQVMWNLLKNAIKFSASGSSISIVTVDSPPGNVTIEFVDHGIGIDAALLPRVFDAFQQGSLSEQRVRGGLGLGLFIAKGLTEAQGGTLTARSEGRGKGSSFLITLPNAPPDHAVLPATETDARFFHPVSPTSPLSLP